MAVSRDEFEAICDPWEMSEFIDANDLNFQMPDTDEIYTGDGYDEYIWDSIRDWGDSWESLSRWLYDLPESGYDYYIQSWGDWEVYDFDGAMYDLKQYIIDTVGFDDDEDDEDEDEDEDDELEPQQTEAFYELWEGAA